MNFEQFLVQRMKQGFPPCKDDKPKDAEIKSFQAGSDLLASPKGRRMPLNVNAKEIWLSYFNKVLFEKGIITEKEKNKMSNLIYKQCHSPNSKKK